MAARKEERGDLERLTKVISKKKNDVEGATQWVPLRRADKGATERFLQLRFSGPVLRYESRRSYVTSRGFSLRQG